MLQRSILGLMILLLMGCGSSRRSPNVVKPIAIDTEQLAQGQQVFMTYCHRCHPNGTAGLGPGLNNKPLPGFAIRFQVRNGVGVMPGFKKEVIPPDQLDGLVAYLKTIRKNKEALVTSRN